MKIVKKDARLITTFFMQINAEADKNAAEVSALSLLMAKFADLNLAGDIF